MQILLVPVVMACTTVGTVGMVCGIKKWFFKDRK